MPGPNERNRGDETRAGREAISAVKLSQRLTADVEAWAEAHDTVRSDALRQLVELGLNASPAPPQHPPAQLDPTSIEDLATEQIERMLDPSLSQDERERRTRRLIEGPPEFSDQRVDLPKHDD
jgi:hypothetical protein